MVSAVPPDIGERLIPTPSGFSSEVKQRAARAERAWEATTGLLGALSATGTAAIAGGLAIPPLAPFLGLIAGCSFYFKLRAKWAKEDPPRPDFELATAFRPPRLDLMPVLPPGMLPSGVGTPALLLTAGASVEATVLCVERAMGAEIAARETADPSARRSRAERLRETQEHAARAELLTISLRAELQQLSEGMLQAITPVAMRWQEHAGRPFTAVADQPTLGRIVAAGIDQRLLTFTLTEVLFSQESVGEVLSEAGAAAEELGASLREWAVEFALDPSAESDYA